MKNKKLFVLAAIIIFIVSGCRDINIKGENSNSSEIPETLVKEPEDNKISDDTHDQKESIIIDKSKENISETTTYDLTTEKAITEYLVGDWISDKETLSDYSLTDSDINCNMSIGEDLSISLTFYNRETKESKGDYEGTISFDRLDEDLNEAPDLISIELTNTDYPGGDFLFKHRTIYDEKRVMSLFFSGNGNCIFDMLADIDNFEYAPEEIIFEKITGEKSQLKPIKNMEFYGVFWGLGKDEKSLWIDEVKWTPNDEYDPQALYPSRMTLYEDDLGESVLYNIATEKYEYIFATGMYAGDVYYVETDKNGNIIEFEDAEYKGYIDLINE